MTQLAPSEVTPTVGGDAVEVSLAVRSICQAAREASRSLAGASAGVKNAALQGIADALLAAGERVVEANAADLARGRDAGLSPSLLDRLRLDAGRIQAIASSVRDVAALPDPVGDVVRGQRLPNGLVLRQERVPLGVVAMVYEARPNVTVDAAALALKSGNAAVLRGGSAAQRTNEAIITVIRAAVLDAGLPPDLVQTVDPFGRAGVAELMRARGLVDVLIPRGGADLIRAVVDGARVPVIETGVGNCHVYVDRAADLSQALAVVLNSKVHRPSVCNAAETILVHRDIAAAFLPDLLAGLASAGVRVHGDEAVARAGSAAGVPVEPATEHDWETEYLAMEAAVGVVDSLDQALERIRRYSTGHTEAICTTDLAAAQRFTTEVDAAAVMVNASTRFTDGGELGLGAEIGISTQKLHARGPMGLTELTTTKWVVTGTGHVRA